MEDQKEEQEMSEAFPSSSKPFREGIEEYNDENVFSVVFPVVVDSVISSLILRRMLLNPSCFFCLWFAIILLLCALILILS